MDEEEGASTEFKLACLASLLAENVVQRLEGTQRGLEGNLLEALLAADGNVTLAAENLSQQLPCKRSRTTDCDDSEPSKSWLTYDTSPASKGVIKRPVLTLGTPELVARHTPCTLIHQALPDDLARRLYHALRQESSDWERNQWYLFDRQVTSPHTTSFYSEGLDGAASEWFYNARQSRARRFTSEMDEARMLIKHMVNKNLGDKKRFPLEYQTEWQPNVAASNCYAGAKENVGWHSDQLTYLGPCPTIASLSLGVTRNFRLKSLQGQTLNIPLRHNTLLIMHAPVQELYKHSIVPMNAIDLWDGRPERYNMTFRFYRPDFAPDNPSGVVRCRCKVSRDSEERMPAVLRPDMKAMAGFDWRQSGEKHNSITLSSPVQESATLYFWMCNAGSQNEGKSCRFFKRLSETMDQRGPFLGLQAI